MKIVVCKDYEEVSRLSAREIIALIKENDKCTLGLATGSSPIGLYQNLINAYNEKDISFANVRTFNLDEYCGIKQNHPQSYYTFMHENLFDHINIDFANVHLPFARNEFKEEDCKVYNNLLNSATIDLQVLGIGANAHIGFNEPKTSFEQETFIVQLTKNTREANKRFFSDLSEVPTHAITMGIKNILKSKMIILVASGEEKAQAIYDMVNGPICAECPASCLRIHEKVIIFIDEKAASLLNRR